VGCNKLTDCFAEQTVGVVRNHEDGTGPTRVAAGWLKGAFGLPEVDAELEDDEGAHLMNLMRGKMAAVLAWCGSSGFGESALKARQSA